MLVKYWQNSIDKFYQLCVIIINIQQFMVQFFHKQIGIEGFIVSAVSTFCFLFLAEDF